MKLHKYYINKGVDSSEVIKIGLVIGGGSGRWLAHIFKGFLEFFINDCCNGKFDKRIILYSNEELGNPTDQDTAATFSSYNTLKKRGKDTAATMQKISVEEAQRLEALYQAWQAEGVEVVFRTSVNAEALYSFRAKVGAIKEVFFTKKQFIHSNLDKAPQSENKDTLQRVLMIRDQIQGFYTNENYTTDNDKAPETIHFQGSFSKQQFEDIITFAKERGEKRLREGFNIWVSYKHHLFGNIIEKWVKTIDPTIQVYQPDTGFTELFAYLDNPKQQKDLLFIAGNEVGDLMYEPIIEIVNSTGRKLDLYSKSFMLNLPNKTNNAYLYELQTVHGSADDLIEKNRQEEILPYATLRIAAAILENQWGIQGFITLMDKVVAKVQLQVVSRDKLQLSGDKNLSGEVTPDSLCTDIVEAVKAEIQTHFYQNSQLWNNQQMKL